MGKGTDPAQRLSAADDDEDEDEADDDEEDEEDGEDAQGFTMASCQGAEVDCDLSSRLSVTVLQRPRMQFSRRTRAPGQGRPFARENVEPRAASDEKRSCTLVHPYPSSSG